MAGYVTFLLLFSLGIFAQDSDIFKLYHSKVKNGQIGPHNAFTHLEEIEGKLFNELNGFFDDLAFVERETYFIAPQDHLNKAADKWSDHFQNKGLRELLEKAAKDGNSVYSDATAKKLFKENRKLSHIIRSTFYVFDEKHAAPKSLEAFVKPFGKLNDAIVAKNKLKIQNYAAKVIKAKSKMNLQNILNEFKSINKEQLEAHLAEVRQRANRLLSKSAHTPHDYHYIRKQYKEFLVIYSNLDTHIPHPKRILLDSFINKLGELNDVYTDIKFRFGMDVETHQVTLPNKFKFQVKESFKFLEEDILSVKLGKSCFAFFRHASN